MVSYHVFSQTRYVSFSVVGKLILLLTYWSTSQYIRSFSSSSTNAGGLEGFVVASAKLYFLLIHMISSMIRSLYASLAAFTYIIDLFSILNALLTMTLKIVSLSHRACIFRSSQSSVLDYVVLRSLHWMHPLMENILFVILTLQIFWI